MHDLTALWSKVQRLPIQYYRKELAYCLLYCTSDEVLQRELLKCVANRPTLHFGPDPIAKFLVLKPFSVTEEYISYLQVPEGQKDSYLYYLMWSILRAAPLYYDDFSKLWEWCISLLRRWLDGAFDVLASRMQRLADIFYKLGRLVYVQSDAQKYLGELLQVITTFLSRLNDIDELEAFVNLLFAARLSKEFGPRPCPVPSRYVNSVQFQAILEPYNPIACITLVSRLFDFNWGDTELLGFLERKLSQLSLETLDVYVMNQIVQRLYASFYDHGWRFDLKKIVHRLLDFLDHCEDINHQLDWLVWCVQLACYDHRDRILQAIDRLATQLEKEYDHLVGLVHS